MSNLWVIPHKGKWLVQAEGRSRKTNAQVIVQTSFRLGCKETRNNRSDTGCGAQAPA